MLLFRLVATALFSVTVHIGCESGDGGHRGRCVKMVNFIFNQHT